MDSAVDIVGKFWFLEIIIGVVILVGINFLFKRIVKQIRSRSLAGTSHWKEKIDYILYVPFQILMWILGITLVIEILGHRFDFSCFGHYIKAFRSTGFVICVGWVLLRWKGVMQRGLLTKEGQVKQIDHSFVQGMGKVLSIVIIMLAVLVILQVWGLNIGALIAFGGIGAAAIGFAAKDVLSNFFGGLMLYINRPFMIGDFIHLPEQGMEGYVEEIGWNLTTIRDKDKRPMYLPNATFSNAFVINAARMTHRRILATVGLRYEDFGKIPALVEQLKSAISRHPDIDTHLPVLVVLNGFGEVGLDVLIDVYTLKTRYDQFLLSKHQILMLVYEEMTKAGAQMANPTMEITGKLTS